MTLYVTDSSDTDADRAETVLSINEILDETSEQKYDEFMETMRAASVPTGTNFPLFHIFWKELVFPGETTGSLVELYFVHRAVKGAITQDIDEIVCDVTDEKFRRPVLDAASPLGISVVDPDGDSISLPNYKQGIATTVSILATTTVVLSDMLIGPVLSLVGSTTSDTSESPNFVFFPFPGRLKSTESVINAATFQHEVVLPGLLTPRLLRSSMDDYPFDKIPRMCTSFRSVGAFLALIRLASGLLAELFISRRGQEALVKHLSREAGVDLPRSVRYAWTTAVQGNSRGLLMTKLTETIYTGWDVDGILVGANGSRERALLHVARSYGIQTYYVPHSVVHPVRNIYMHNPETTMFVESELTADYLRQNRPTDTLPELRVLGRPYFENLLEYQPDGDGERDNRITITLATQDQMERAREAFATTALRAIADGVAKVSSVRVIVKTHPSETTALYDRLQSELSIESIDEVKIREGELYRTLQESDLVVTVNSNVGIESMIAGTPCACIVLFEPWIPVYPYALHGSVPVLTTESETASFFEQLDHDMIDTIQDEQRRHISDSYVLRPDIGDTIAQYIADDCIS